MPETRLSLSAFRCLLTPPGLLALPSHSTMVLRLKIVSLGDSGVGKSCLIKRYCENKFVARYIATIGVDYGVKPATVGDTEARVNFFDLSGIDAYADIRSEFYKDSNGVSGSGSEVVEVV